MMDRTALISKNVKLFIAMSIFALIGGYLYVMAFGVGYRGIIAIHGSILFFAGMAVFLRNIKTFLIFSLLFGLAFYYGYFLIYDPPGLKAPPFIMGIRLDATDIPLILCYIHWGISLASNNGITRPTTIGGRVGWLFLAWIFYIFISSFISATNLTYSLYEGIVYIKGFLFYLYLINNIRDEYDLKVVVYALCGGCLIESAFMMVQYIAKKNYMIQAYYEVGFLEGFRSVGFLSHPDACIILLATIFPIFVIGLFIVKDVFKKFMIGFSIFLILLAAGFSQTRIAAAVFGIGVVLSFLISYRRGWISKGQILIATASIPLMVLAFIPFAYERFATAAYGEERWPLAVTAYRVFKAHTLFGVGPSNYNFVVDRYIPASFAGKWVFTVHVEYLLRLAETGILGFLVFYSFILTVTARLYKSTFSKRPLIFLVSCGLFSSMIASFVHRVTSIYAIPQIFFLMCAVYALSVTVGLLEESVVSQSSHQKLNQSFDTGQEQDLDHTDPLP
ncbi:MAG: O-antigen ligase family protein [Desulfomonilaceae bacterium]